MADTKISNETPAGPLSGNELIPAVQGGANVKLTPAQIITYGGGVGSVLSVTKTITTAEILTGFSTPVTVLAAQGAGTFIQIISPIIWKFNFAGAAFATNVSSRVYYNSTVSVFAPLMDASTIIGIANSRYQFNPITVMDFQTSLGENVPITWQVSTGNPTAGGTSTLTIHFKYYVLTL